MSSSLTFHYETSGNRSNPALLFLHGFMGSSADWAEDIVPLLSNEHYCISLDLPGHGRTKAEHRDDYSMNRCAAGITGLLDSLAVSQADVIGYSMGGRLALYMAVNFQGRVGKVVIESASPGLANDGERRARVEQDRKLADRMQHAPIEQYLDEWYAQPLFATMDKASDSYQKMLKRRIQNDPRKLRLSLEMMGTGAQPPLWDKLEKIRSQILMVVGEHDEKFRQIADEMARHCLSAKTAVVENAGHCVHFENPQEYVKLVSQFLKS